MAGETWRAVGGVNRKVKEWYRAVGGVNQKIKKVYRGVSGVNREVFTSGIDVKYTITHEGSGTSQITWSGGESTFNFLPSDQTQSNGTIKLQFDTPITVLNASIEFYVSRKKTTGVLSIRVNTYHTLGYYEEYSGVSGSGFGDEINKEFTKIIGKECTGFSISFGSAENCGASFTSGTAFITINEETYKILIPENTPENTTFILEPQ